MRIALSSDEPYPVHAVIREELLRRGHEVLAFGAMQNGQEESWVRSTEEAARAVASGTCDEGIFLCWTGTGASIVANKVAGIRAALCTDAVTAKGARIWNHANVLCLSNRLLSQDLAKEILAAWFEADPGSQGEAGVAALIEADARHRKGPTT